MTLDALIMLLGTFVALLPFLGFPNSWDSILLLVAGIIIILLGIVVRRRGSKKEHFVAQTPPDFVESSPLDLTRHERQD